MTRERNEWRRYQFMYTYLTSVKVVSHQDQARPKRNSHLWPTEVLLTCCISVNYTFLCLRINRRLYINTSWQLTGWLIETGQFCRGKQRVSSRKSYCTRNNAVSPSRKRKFCEWSWVCNNVELVTFFKYIYYQKVQQNFCNMHFIKNFGRSYCLCTCVYFLRADNATIMNARLRP